RQYVKEQKAKEILEEYEEKRVKELKLAKEKSQVKTWLEEEKEDSLKEIPQKIEESQGKLDEWLADEEEELTEDLGLPILALVCFLAGFAGIWKQWIFPGIGMILVGCIVLVLSFLQKNQDKNLSDVRSMIQLEDKEKEEVFLDDNPYTM